MFRGAELALIITFEVKLLPVRMKKFVASENTPTAAGLLRGNVLGSCRLDGGKLHPFGKDAAGYVPLSIK